jgi:hypothetical protein
MRNVKEARGCDVGLGHGQPRGCGIKRDHLEVKQTADLLPCEPVNFGRRENSSSDD